MHALSLSSDRLHQQCLCHPSTTSPTYKYSLAPIFLLHPVNTQTPSLRVRRSPEIEPEVLASILCPAMAAHVDPLVVGRVIGDVVDMFVPTMPVSVRFGNRDLTNGCEIKPSIAAAPPAVQVAGRANDLFTLVLTDPDAPSPSEPTMRECLHWLVVNIPGGSDPSQGEEVVPYMGPRPPLGIHRYVLVLFQQKARVAAPAPSGEVVRARFSTRAFAQRHGLGLPVAAMYFNAQKEPASRRRPY